MDERMPRRFVLTEGIATVTNLDDFVKGKITSCTFVAFFKNMYCLLDMDNYNVTKTDFSVQFFIIIGHAHLFVEICSRAIANRDLQDKIYRS